MSVSAIEDMGRLDYLRRRQEYIGGSDAAGVLGVSPFDTPESIYRKKTLPVEELPELDNRHIRRGVYMEDVVQKMLTGEIDNGSDPIAPFAEEGEHMRHDEHEYIGGTPDAVDASRVYEIKCPTMDKLGEITSDGVPRYWMAQVHHYMLLTGKPATVCIFDYDGWDIYTVDVEPDPEFEVKMLRVYHEFWEHVQEGTVPDTPSVKNSEIRVGKGGDKLNNLLAQYIESRELGKEAKRRKKELKTKIASRCRHLDVVKTDDFRCKISRQTSSTGKDYIRLYINEST
jgi:putative phage-type endonuclease